MYGKFPAINAIMYTIYMYVCVVIANPRTHTNKQAYIGDEGNPKKDL